MHVLSNKRNLIVALLGTISISVSCGDSKEGGSKTETVEDKHKISEPVLYNKNGPLTPQNRTLFGGYDFVRFWEDNNELEQMSLASTMVCDHAKQSFKQQAQLMGRRNIFLYEMMPRDVLFGPNKTWDCRIEMVIKNKIGSTHTHKLPEFRLRMTNEEGEITLTRKGKAILAEKGNYSIIQHRQFKDILVPIKANDFDQIQLECDKAIIPYIEPGQVRKEVHLADFDISKAKSLVAGIKDISKEIPQQVCRVVTRSKGIITNYSALIPVQLYSWVGASKLVGGVTLSYTPRTHTTFVLSRSKIYNGNDIPIYVAVQKKWTNAARASFVGVSGWPLERGNWRNPIILPEGNKVINGPVARQFDQAFDVVPTVQSDFGVEPSQKGKHIIIRINPHKEATVIAQVTMKPICGYLRKGLINYAEGGEGGIFFETTELKMIQVANPQLNLGNSHNQVNEFYLTQRNKFWTSAKYQMGETHISFKEPTERDERFFQNNKRVFTCTLD